MGAEFFHGSSAAAKQLSDEFGLSTDQIFTTAHGDGGPDDEPAPDGGLGYYVAEDETVLPWDSTDRGFVALNDALDRMREYTGDDQMSVAAFLRAQGVPERMLSLAAASYSNTLGVGSDLESLPLRAVAHLERLWLVDGYGDFCLADDRTTGGGDGVGTPRGLGRLCAPLAHGIELRLSWPVATIATAAGRRNESMAAPCATLDRGGLTQWGQGGVGSGFQFSVNVNEWLDGQEVYLSFDGSAPLALPTTHTGSATSSSPAIAWLARSMSGTMLSTDEWPSKPGSKRSARLERSSLITSYEKAPPAQS